MLKSSIPFVATCAFTLLVANGCHRPPTAPTRDLADKYEDRDARYSERPGPHSTTTGRHGTAGEAGGGIDAQSGPDEPNMDEETTDRPRGSGR